MADAPESNNAEPQPQPAQPPATEPLPAVQPAQRPDEAQPPATEPLPGPGAAAAPAQPPAQQPPPEQPKSSEARAAELFPRRRRVRRASAPLMLNPKSAEEAALAARAMRAQRAKKPVQTTPRDPPRVFPKRPAGGPRRSSVSTLSAARQSQLRAMKRRSSTGLPLPSDEDIDALKRFSEAAERRTVDHQRTLAQLKEENAQLLDKYAGAPSPRAGAGRRGSSSALISDMRRLVTEPGASGVDGGGGGGGIGLGLGEDGKLPALSPKRQRREETAASAAAAAAEAAASSRQAAVTSVAYPMTVEKVAAPASVADEPAFMDITPAETASSAAQRRASITSRRRRSSLAAGAAKREAREQEVRDLLSRE